MAASSGVSGRTCCARMRRETSGMGVPLQLKSFAASGRRPLARIDLLGRRIRFAHSESCRGCRKNSRRHSRHRTPRHHRKRHGFQARHRHHTAYRHGSLSLICRREGAASLPAAWSGPALLYWEAVVSPGPPIPAPAKTLDTAPAPAPVPVPVLVPFPAIGRREVEA